MIWFYLIGGILIAFFLFFFVFGYFCFRTACVRRSSYPADRTEHGGESLPPLLAEAREWFDSQSFEDITICSHDGLRLHGRILTVKEPPKGAILLFHGYHSSARRDFSLHAKLLHEAGYHLLLADQRAHGESQGTYICFGAKECTDVGAWCQFATRRFGEELPLALLGISMGASSVMMSMNASLPTSVRHIVADCGFTDPFSIIKRRLLQKHKIYPYPVIFFMNYWARTLAGFDYEGISSATTVKESRLPLLLIHGDEDRYVPISMSKTVYEARPEGTEFLTVKGATHARALLSDPDGYMTALLRFLES